MNEKVDQHKLAEDISSKIKYEFNDYFLVKLLDPIKVVKEFSKPKSDKDAVTDKNGINAVDFEDVETETKEVDSDFRKGIILKIPTSVYVDEKVSGTFKVGDTIVFPATAGKTFDLLKDSRLVRYYDVIAIER